jgi:hypothetical protein
MNRRMALMLSTLLGGLFSFPGLAVAQTVGTRKAAPARDKTLRPVSRDNDPEEPAPNDEPAAPFSPEAGFEWRRYPITRYTKLANSLSSQLNPQKAIIEWIFKRTGVSEWHGEKIAVLSATQTELRAYNSPEILKQVDEVVERFTNATDNVLSVHVQYIAAVDTRWRYSVFSRLTYVGSGPQGQQIWTTRLADAALVLSQMSIQQGFHKLEDQRIEMVNGQMLTIKRSAPHTYAAGVGSQSRTDKIEEGITLKLSPLLDFDGKAVDAIIDLAVNTVRSFHRTRVIAPREVAPNEMAVDVPESSQTRLDQTVKNWRLGQTLVISAGIHPGILDKKGGWFNLPIPGTYPTGTEVLVFLDIETVSPSKIARGLSADTESTPAKSDAKPRARNSDSSVDDNPPPDRRSE